MSLYQHQRKFYLSGIRQLRMMIADGRQVSEARSMVKKAQRRAADLRASCVTS
jgi:hypothetical protein